jgi:uncharacterized protein (DUF2252 family)
MKPDEEAAAARARRPRSSHAEWSPAPGRQSPVAILAEQGRSRIPELLPLRMQRMRQSAFAFLRGAAAVMAADLGSQDNTGLTVQLCGDAHLANFGSFASPEGRPVFDVNDFDETLPGPFEWDVKRLATSLVVNGREQGLGHGACQRLAEECVRAYRRQMHRMADMSPLEAWLEGIDLLASIDEIDQHRLRRRLERNVRAVLDAAQSHFGIVETDAEQAAGLSIRDRGQTRHLPGYESTIDAAFAAYPASLLPHQAALVDRYRLVDRAFKVVGVGSVGTFCAIGLFGSAHGSPLLLQVKEAQESVLAPFAGASAYQNQGERVVAGQRLMQSEPDMFLGHAPDRIDGRFFYVRRIKDARLADIGVRLEADALPFAACLCGRTLARAHGRAGRAAAIAAYIGHGHGFGEAIATFAQAYADQTETDFAVFAAAVDAGNGRV